jgi:hypothetical protein
MVDVGKIDITATYDNNDLELPPTLPDVSASWYMAIYPVSIKAEIKTSSGMSFVMPETMIDSVEKLMTVGMVVRQGKMCYKWSQYKDPETGKYLKWCDEGDWVVFGRDSNCRAVTHQGKKFWILPDEAILYRVGHPNEIDPRYEFNENEINALKEKVKELNNGR